MSLSKKIIDAGFKLRAEGNKLIISPHNELKPNQLEFLKLHKAKIIEELTQQQAGNNESPLRALHPIDKFKLNSWLLFIGETDQELIDDFFMQCETSADALRYFMQRVKEM
ncbi:MAG: hypothetical protein ACOYM1_12040 [Methylovulum sp.]